MEGCTEWRGSGGYIDGGRVMDGYWIDMRFVALKIPPGAERERSEMRRDEVQVAVDVLMCFDRIVDIYI